MDSVCCFKEGDLQHNIIALSFLLLITYFLGKRVKYYIQGLKEVGASDIWKDFCQQTKQMKKDIQRILAEKKDRKNKKGKK